MSVEVQLGCKCPRLGLTRIELTRKQENAMTAVQSISIQPKTGFKYMETSTSEWERWYEVRNHGSVKVLRLGVEETRQK